MSTPAGQRLHEEKRMYDLAPLPVAPSRNLNPLNPAAHYLANLAPSGRRTTAGALVKIGTMLTGLRCCATDYPWHLVSYEHASAVRAILVAEYAPATVNKHLTALRGVMKEAWRLGLISGDELARVVDVQNVRGSRLPRGRMLSADELRTLWKVADNLGARYGALLALLFSGGLRRSEAAGVALEHLTEEVEPDGSVTVWIKVLGKGQKERRVPVRGSAACRLQRARGHRDGLVLGVGGGRGVAKLLARVIRMAAIPHASCHDLRRSFVSHALAGGAPIADVARAAGHSDPRTTAGYDRRGDEALVGVADALPE